jgi:amino acid carrier protein
MVILQAIQDFGNWFWGIPILILIGGGGLFLTIYLGFPQIRHFGYAMSQTFGKMFAKKEEGKVRPISAAFAALACAVGASNIVGVPVAIALGGPGAVFWIWILAIFGMCTKYCEVAMGIKYRRKNDVGEWVGGPAYYLRGLGKKIGVVFGVGYAFFFMIELVPSLASQGVSAAEQFNVFGANQTVTGIIIAVLVGVILAGGFKRVSSVTDILVPVMACLYVLGALVIIFAHVGELPAIFGMIFQDAFTGRAAVGGFAGATVMAAIRWGAARGVYSNEAGTGMAPLAHSSSSANHPVKQGLWGISEVFVDTIIVCTMTALVVLCTGVWTEGGTGAALTATAFGAGFGNAIAGTVFVVAIITFFAFTTALVNVYYGEICMTVLGGKKFILPYRLLGCAFAIIGSVGALSVLWNLFDFFFGVCAVCNLVVCFLMRKQIGALINDYLTRLKSGKWEPTSEAAANAIPELWVNDKAAK